MGMGTRQGPNGMYTEMVALVQDMDTVPVSFPVLVPSSVSAQCEYVITYRLNSSNVVTERETLNITFYACVGDNY